ncbi:uncharacterized protein LOC113398198 isoform X1 [Vanessa tameamea]|uniref:Uncharacterized protein LOC113398198 isoform X1 n=1 Tax=Vanessa tameamea TaxID=334116 RepID=A0A8B8I684_VANTA
MGQAGSQPGAEQRARRAHTLPHEPLRHAPKVLPVLTESPRLRSTDNGAILHSGGTISGRRPGSLLQENSRLPHGHVHSNVYRSRSAGVSGESDIRSRERDPLHRSHTNLDLRHNEANNLNKRFGSEPDLRIEEEQQKPRCNNNKNFRKKYRAPPPPSNDYREGSSPDSSAGNAKIEPQRNLRLFRTRNETKKLNGHVDSKIPVYKNTYTDFKSLDFNDHFERRYKSPFKDKEPCFSYVDNKDMVQSTTSLKKEERLLQPKQDYRKTRTDRISGCRAKTSKTSEQSEAWKTPLLNRNFRHSERFKKDNNEQPLLRREKTFDETLTISERKNESPRALHEKKIKAIGEELSNKLSPLGQRNQPLRKSLPSLLSKGNEEKDEFQEELKKATSRIRKELGSKLTVSENKPSQNDKTSTQKPNPTKSVTQSKVTESSLKSSTNKQDSKPAINNINRRPLRINEAKPKATPQNKINKINEVSKYKFESKEDMSSMPDRGQASGKESTPEHSPTRKRENTNTVVQEKQRPTPSKQFYFGMIESKKMEPQDHLKDFPGLGSPIIEELSNFHLIEKKLLGYHEEDEMEKFNEKLKEDCKRNLSSESALSSDGSEGEGSDGSLGIALRLRPTLPKKLPNTSRFSPAAAWRQLASLDAHLAESQPLAVETKMSADVSAESSPRSEQSADKSGDSGISGDHGHSDHRIDSPRHAVDQAATWTPQQDLGDSSSDGAGQELSAVTYSPAQTFSLSLPRDQDKFKGVSCFYECFQGKPLQQGFNSLQKLRKSVSGALGAALGARRFDLEHEPMLEEPEQNWFLTKSAPNSLSNPLLYHQPLRTKISEDNGKEEPALSSEKGQEEGNRWRNSSYMNWGGHVMYLPPAPGLDQPLSLPNTERPIRSKSSGCLEASARAARAALAGEMRERERSASPDVARALPARVEPAVARNANAGRGKRFTFQSTVRQLERRRLAEKLSREADLKEQQRRTELEAMRRVEEEFQRKRAREKANIRQQLRLVSSGATSLPVAAHQNKTRDEPDGSCRESPAPERARDGKQRHSNASSEGSGRSKSSTPIRCVELSEWRTENGARVYRDWAVQAALAHAHPPACARMPSAHHYTGGEGEAFSGSPRSDNYRLEFARGRSPRTPRAPRLLAARSPASSSSGSDLSLRQPIKIREPTKEEDAEEPAIVPTLRPSGPSRSSVAIR